MGVFYDIKYKLWEYKNLILEKIIVILENNSEYNQFIKNNSDSTAIVNKVFYALQNKQMISEGELLKVVNNCYELEIRNKLTCAINAYNSQNLEDMKNANRKVLDFIIEQNKNISVEILRLSEKILILLSDYIIAYEIRIVSQERLIEKYKTLKKVPSKYYMDLFWALDETHRFDLQKELVKKIKKINIVSDKKTQLFLLSKLGFENLNISDKFKNRKDSIQFNEAVKGKEIAIIGPGPQKENIGNVYTEFDYIVKINDQKNNDYAYKTINYFNSMQGRHFLKKSESDNILEKFKYSVFKYLPIEKKDFNRRETIPNINKLQYNAEANMIQLILTDLLYFQPSRVKVYYVNFYLSKIAYDEKYKKDLAFSERNCLQNGQTFANHSYISQWLYTKKLYELNLIEFDELAEKCLKLSTREYVKQFDEIYSIFKNN